MWKCTEPFKFCTISCHISTPKTLIAYVLVQKYLLYIPVMLCKSGCGSWSVEKIAYITTVKWGVSQCIAYITTMKWWVSQCTHLDTFYACDKFCAHWYLAV